MFTIGNFWWLIVLSVIVVFLIWYWTICALHRAVEKISAEGKRPKQH